MIFNPLYIYACSSLSTRGEGLQIPFYGFSKHTNREGQILPVGKIPTITQEKLNLYLVNYPHQEHLDRTARLGLYALKPIKNFLENIKKSEELSKIGVFIGTSRGATDLIENAISRVHNDKPISVFTSPFTTQGSVASILAQDIIQVGRIVSNTESATCSSSFHALLNAYAWIQSGMIRSAVVGGIEAPITDFTLSQMQSLRLYSTYKDGYPCKPFQIMDNPKNSFVLGEGAGLFFLSQQKEINGYKPLAKINGIGYYTEKLNSPTSISPNGLHFIKSMEMALQGKNSLDINTIIAHAPGTVLGDSAELNAIQTVFQNKLPNIISTKWFTGHTLGASGALSLEYALRLLQGKEMDIFPYPTPFTIQDAPIQHILINSAGFGGQSISVLLSHIE